MYEILPIQESLTLYMNVVTQLQELRQAIYKNLYCGYQTDRDVAAGQNIRNRGIKLISTVGQTGKETACADDLPGLMKVSLGKCRNLAREQPGNPKCE